MASSVLKDSRVPVNAVTDRVVCDLLHIARKKLPRLPAAKRYATKLFRGEHFIGVTDTVQGRDVDHGVGSQQVERQPFPRRTRYIDVKFHL